MHVRAFPDATALVCGPRNLTYVEYFRCVAGFADELVRHGARGSRVALVCANSLDMPIAMFGIHAAGAQAVPINPTYTERELSYILERCGSDCDRLRRRTRQQNRAAGRNAWHTPHGADRRRDRAQSRYLEARSRSASAAVVAHVPMISRPCNIPVARPAGRRASISATDRWRLTSASARLRCRRGPAMKASCA